MRVVKKYHRHNPKNTHSGEKLQLQYNQQQTSKSEQHQPKWNKKSHTTAFILEILSLFAIARPQLREDEPGLSSKP